MSTAPDLQTERTAALIRRVAGQAVEIATRTIGRGGFYRNAAHAALSLRFGRGIAFDVIHAFDSPSLLAACAAPSPVIFSPFEPRAAPWWRAAMVYRNGTAIANTAAMERQLIRQGLPASRCDVIPPAVETNAFAEPRDNEANQQLRALLGISADDRVILAPGESTRAAGHMLALHSASILHVLDPRWRLLIWGRGPSVNRLARLARQLHQSDVLVDAESKLGRPTEFERLIPMADVALVASPVAPPIPIAMCMSAGVPIVSAVAPAILELLEDRRTASLVPTFAPRLLAQRLLQTMEHPTEPAAWALAARAESARRFDRRQTVNQFLALYHRAAGVSPKGGTRDRLSNAAL